MPKSEIAASAEARLKALYPEGGPGRQLKSRLAAREVLVGGMVLEYTRPSLMKLYQQAGYDFVYIEYEHAYFDMVAFADTVRGRARQRAAGRHEDTATGATRGREALGMRSRGDAASPHGDAGGDRDAHRLHQALPQGQQGERDGLRQQRLHQADGPSGLDSRAGRRDGRWSFTSRRGQDMQTPRR